MTSGQRLAVRDRLVMSVAIFRSLSAFLPSAIHRKPPAVTNFPWLSVRWVPMAPARLASFKALAGSTWAPRIVLRIALMALVAGNQVWPSLSLAIECHAQSACRFSRSGGSFRLRYIASHRLNPQFLNCISLYGS